MQNLIYSSILTLVAVLADALVKKAAMTPPPAMWAWLIAGLIIYAAAGVGWFFVMKSMPLYAIGIVFSVVSAIALTLTGIFIFQETVTVRELAGIVLGIVSLILVGWKTAA